MYYTSLALQGSESRYPSLKKLVFIFITSARRLQPYFQAQTIVVLTYQPLQKILSRPEMSGRLINWALELEEFKVLYRPRTGIKGQTLADFVVEFTYPEESVEEPALPDLPLELQGFIPTWVLHRSGKQSRRDPDHPQGDPNRV